MADNYLEKRYEEYLKRKAEYERRKKLGLIKKKPISSAK
mgnify:CR=1 FL=1|jgi:hypothetical protein